MRRDERKVLEVFATGFAGRRLVQEIWNHPHSGHKYNIATINHRGEFRAWERGGRTVAITKAISANILRSQRFTDVEFRRV